MSIVLFRIDDRLIHGQVVVGWAQPLDVGFLVLVDDEVAASGWEQELYRMGVPPAMDVFFDDVATAARRLPTYATDPRAGIVLTGDIATMRALADATAAVPAVNLGGLHHRPGRTQRLRYVFLTDAEADELRAFAATGVSITAQDLPSAPPLALEEVLAGRGDA